MSDMERLLARIQAASHMAWCDMQGRLQDDTHKLAHRVLEQINRDASEAITAWNRRASDVPRAVGPTGIRA